jgi:hypothetical protein
MPLRSPTRLSVWIAGGSICLLLASGMVAIARLIPASYADVPQTTAVAKQQNVLSQVTLDRGHRKACQDCGVIESMRQRESVGDTSRQEALEANAGRGAPSGSSAGAGATNVVAAKSYEFTVRFRDGSTAIFTETGPRVWRLGSRVMVIGRSNQ